MFRKIPAPLLFALMIAALLPSPTPADPSALRFTVTDLGTLGGAQTEANAVNDRGQIVGEANTATGELHAFFWQDGHIQDLGTLGGKRSVAEGINAEGQVVGVASRADGKTDIFLWEKGRMHDLGTLGGSVSTVAHITGSGGVIGSVFSADGKASVSYVWTPHAGMRKLQPWVNVGYASIVNERGEFVVSIKGGDGKRHTRIGQIVEGTFRTPANGILKDTDLLIDAVALNSLGHAVGENTYIGLNGNYSPKPRAYLWTPSSLTDLGSLGGQEFLARCINNQDEVVGLAGVLVPGAKPYLSGALPEEMHAFLWERGVLHDLNALIPAEEGWTLWDALGLNRRGQIVGTGLHHGKQHAFLLTPISEVQPPADQAMPQ